ncbi:MAG: hypothetical protein PHD51_04330 [Patescibacteria group bacterium]|nr:hypothetical protein [Patescibacteria group bacterium]MDD5490851.1 hypothetical protein [Patescibacteria group bacterium]
MGNVYKNGDRWYWRPPTGKEIEIQSGHTLRCGHCNSKYTIIINNDGVSVERDKK